MAKPFAVLRWHDARQRQRCRSRRCRGLFAERRRTTTPLPCDFCPLPCDLHARQSSSFR
jgi:hypothetical protein